MNKISHGVAFCTIGTKLKCNKCASTEKIWFSSQMRQGKARANLCLRAVSPDLPDYRKYGEGCDRNLNNMAYWRKRFELVTRKCTFWQTVKIQMIMRYFIGVYTVR